MFSAGKRIFIILLISWIAADLLQAFLMEVHSDEAYYFLYGQNPAWGYYDHPPMVGWMTALGTAVFGESNIGIRICTVLAHAITLIILWNLIGLRNPDRRQVTLFFTIAASCIMFQVYGFMTTPDPYLLLFTAVFLWAYRRFLEQENWNNTLVLALAMAGMLYSKYHGILVILFTVLSYPRLLAKPKAWAAVLITAVLMLPHLWWQVANNFPAVRYHLTARSSGFSIGDMLGYLPVQLVVFNPVTVYAFIRIVLASRHSRNQFEKTCRFQILGFVMFFFLMTLKGHVEPQWTVAASIPLIFIVYSYALDSVRLQRLTTSWILPTVGLTALARVLLLTPVLPSSLGFHGKQAQYEVLASKTGTELPVVFCSSFQNPSLFRYFIGGKSTALSSVTTRTTQFDIWKWEEQWTGQPVWMVNREMDRIERIGEFQSANRLEIEYTLTSLPQDWPHVHPGDSITLEYVIYNRTPYAVDLRHPELPLELKAVFTEHKRLALQSGVSTSSATLLPAATEEAPTTISGTFSFTVPEMELRKNVKLGLVLDNGRCAPLLSPQTKAIYHDNR